MEADCVPSDSKNCDVDKFGYCKIISIVNNEFSQVGNNDGDHRALHTGGVGRVEPSRLWKARQIRRLQLLGWKHVRLLHLQAGERILTVFPHFSLYTNQPRVLPAPPVLKAPLVRMVSAGRLPRWRRVKKTKGRALVPVECLDWQSD